MSEEQGKRLFLGLRISVPTANQLAQCADQLARRARDANLEAKWVSPASYHVTLKFLGWTREDMVPALVDRIGKAIAGIAPFKFKVAKLGAFPSLDKATVLWAGVEDPGAIAKLAELIEAAAVEIGFAAEPRGFHPHVTLARVRETRLLRDVVLPMSEQMFSGSLAESVILYESDAKSSSSAYREIARIDLKTASEPGSETEKRQTGALDLGDETDDGWPRNAATREHS